MSFSITVQSNTPSPHILAHLILCWLEKGNPCSSRSKRDRRNSFCRLIVFQWATTSCRHSFRSKIVNYRFDSVLFFTSVVLLYLLYLCTFLRHWTIEPFYHCTLCTVALLKYCTALTWKNSVAVQLFDFSSLQAALILFFFRIVKHTLFGKT